MTILLFHALARTHVSMKPMVQELEKRGYKVHAVRFPTIHRSLESAARKALEDLDRLGIGQGGDGFFYVAHSLGGLLVRKIMQLRPDFRFKGGVLLGSPICGSQIANRLGGKAWMQVIYGRILDDMTTGAAAELPPPPGRFATIAGTAVNPLLPASSLNRLLSPGEPSDSTVLVRETHHPDEIDHFAVECDHYHLPSDEKVLTQIIYFLEHGRFERLRSSH